MVSKGTPMAKTVIAAEEPKTFELLQNFPNPFNPTTMISYDLPEATHVQLSVYDMLGREVASLVNADQSTGRYSVSFDASHLASGVYFYRIETAKFSQIQKMVLMK